jgi:hypothetical protein
LVFTLRFFFSIIFRILATSGLYFESFFIAPKCCFFTLAVWGFSRLWNWR